MPSLLRLWLLCSALASAGAARAETVIGVAAPLSGPTALLGRQVLAGAQAAAARGNAIRIVSADDQCSAEGGAEAARALVAASARSVVGFLCTEAIEAALPIFKEAGVAVITVGVRTDSLSDRRDRTGWPFVRLAPRADAERGAAGRLIPRLWREVSFAIVDDGTIYGRELAESVRAGAEEQGLRPVFVDTFRPQMENQAALVGRLRRAGATHVFVGGDRQDIAVMARDAAEGEPLLFAGGEALRAEPGPVALPAGVLMVGLPDPADKAEPALLSALGETGLLPEGYFLPSFAAVEVAAQASGAPLLSPPDAAFLSKSFITAIGTITFNEKGDLRDNPFRLFRFNGTRFVPVPTP